MKEQKICSKCKIKLPASDFYLKSPNQLKSSCKKCFNKYINNNSLRANKTRKLILTKLGGLCASCSFSGKLEIDHVAGDGNQHRIEIPNRSSYLSDIWRTIESGRYQLLCLNCHTHKSNLESNYEMKPLRGALLNLLDSKCITCNFAELDVLLIKVDGLVVRVINNQLAADVLVNRSNYHLKCRNCHGLRLGQ